MVVLYKRPVAPGAPMGSGSTSDAEMSAYRSAVGPGQVSDAEMNALRRAPMGSGSTSDAEFNAYRNAVAAVPGQVSEGEKDAYQSYLDQMSQVDPSRFGPPANNPQALGQMSNREGDLAQRFSQRYIDARKNLEKNSQVPVTPSGDPAVDFSRRQEFQHQGNIPPQGLPGAGMDFPTATTGMVNQRTYVDPAMGFVAEQPQEDPLSTFFESLRQKLLP
jgi:hypothetical protein